MPVLFELPHAFFFLSGPMPVFSSPLQCFLGPLIVFVAPASPWLFFLSRYVFLVALSPYPPRQGLAAQEGGMGRLARAVEMTRKVFPVSETTRKAFPVTDISS